MEWLLRLDIYATILTVTGCILLAKKIIWCWPCHLVANLLWIGHFLPQMEYPVALTQTMYMALNVYGWINWKKLEKKGR